MGITPRRSAFLAVLATVLLRLGAAGPASAAPIKQDLGGRVAIDWTAMRLVAVGAGAPDLRAPNAAIARVGAERRARVAALAILTEAARKLPLAAGGTVGERAKDEKIDAALRAALRLTRDVAVDYGSDGSVEITLGVPLEAIRQAVSAPASPPVADDTAPTAILVEAKLAPVLGISLSAGAETVEGPTIWVVSRAAASADPRVGERPIVAKLRARADKKKGAKGVKQLDVDLEPKALAAARAAGALVVIIGAKAP